MRSLARESVFKYIFSRLFNPSDEGLFVVLCNDLNEDDKLFATKLLTTLLENEQEYLNCIQNLSVSFDIDRIFSTDKSAILIAMAELDCYPQTPVAIVIDEAVNIVAKYSTENSTNFVNGILAKYVKEKKND